MSQTAKCLSIRQPFAWAIFARHSETEVPLKRVENRDWFSPYRGSLLIHAGAQKPKSLLLPDGTEAPSDELEYGVILGMVHMAGCVEYLQGGILSDDPFAVGPFCFIFEHPSLFLEPVAYKGNLKFFDVPLDALD